MVLGGQQQRRDAATLADQQIEGAAGRAGVHAIEADAARFQFRAQWRKNGGRQRPTLAPTQQNDLDAVRSRRQLVDDRLQMDIAQGRGITRRVPGLRMERQDGDGAEVALIGDREGAVAVALNGLADRFAGGVESAQGLTFFADSAASAAASASAFSLRWRLEKYHSSGAAT